jgi:hypothetical protein
MRLASVAMIACVMTGCAPKRQVSQAAPARTGSGSPAPVRWKHISSVEGAVPVAGPTDQDMSLVLDIDKDGINDFVVAGRRSPPAMTWFRRGRDGWTRYVIDPSPTPIEAGGAYYDIDGDGDLDIVAGEDYQGDRVYWWENPRPEFNPDRAWKRHVIKDAPGRQHHDQSFGDFDGDGRTDLAFWNQQAKKLFLSSIPADPKLEPWPVRVIYEGSGEGMAAADIDGDRKVDLIAGGRWFHHEGGDRFTVNWIDEKQQIARVAAADLNGDGRPDVAMSPGESAGRLMWYENTGDSGKRWIAHDLLGADVLHAHSLAIADFNADGRPDILCAEMRKWSSDKDDNPGCRMWVFYGNGKGGFSPTIVATGYGVHEARAADLDGDGRIDILAKPFNWQTPRMDIWLNLR